MEELIKYADKPLEALQDFVKRGFLKPVNTLEVNCGAGVDAMFLANKRFKVTGIDESQTLINFAKHNDTQSKCKFQKKGALPLEFSSRSFKLVVDKSHFMGLDKKEYEHYIREVYRVLDVNGRLVLATLTKESPRFDLKNILNKNYLSENDMYKLFKEHFSIKHTHNQVLEDEMVLKTYLMEKK